MAVLLMFRAIFSFLLKIILVPDRKFHGNTTDKTSVWGKTPIQILVFFWKKGGTDVYIQSRV